MAPRARTDLLLLSLLSVVALLPLPVRNGDAQRLPRDADEPAREVEDPRFAAELYAAKRLPRGQAAVAPARYLALRDRLRGMAHKSGEAWSYLGPGNVGGRTRALVIDPLRPRTMYAGGVDGGVWKTTDGGASWLPLGDLLPSLAVASLALDPSHRGVL